MCLRLMKVTGKYCKNDCDHITVIAASDWESVAK